MQVQVTQRNIVAIAAKLNVPNLEQPKIKIGLPAANEGDSRMFQQTKPQTFAYRSNKMTKKVFQVLAGLFCLLWQFAASRRLCIPDEAYDGFQCHKPGSIVSSVVRKLTMKARDQDINVNASVKWFEPGVETEVMGVAGYVCICKGTTRLKGVACQGTINSTAEGDLQVLCATPEDGFSCCYG
jgi:hypothetical protein